MSKEIINEILVVEVEFPWERLSTWDKKRLEEMRAEFIKNYIQYASSITLTGVITGVGPGGYEKKNLQIKI